MNDLVIEATENSPAIVGEVSGTLKISGKSLMEDALSFYTPVHEWMSKFMEGTAGNINIIIDLVYFNSSAAKQILRLLMFVDEFESDAKVKWFYPEGNDLLESRGREFEVMLDLPFEYIQKPLVS